MPISRSYDLQHRLARGRGLVVPFSWKPRHWRRHVVRVLVDIILSIKIIDGVISIYVPRMNSVH